MTEKPATKDRADIQVMLAWWNDLQERSRGDRAQLRRCHDLNEIMMSQGFMNLRRRLQSEGHHYNNNHLVPLAAIAGILANMDEHVSGERFGKQLASSSGEGSKAAVSGLRFRRLLSNQTVDDLYVPLVRTLRMLRRKANATDLIWSIQRWEESGSPIQRQWAESYYMTAPEEP